MNGSNPIFPLVGIGQTTPVQTGQMSEGGDTAFAENLTAALAALSLTTVMPVQQKTETPIASLGGLVDGSLDAAISATDSPGADGGVQAAGVFGPTGHADVRSAPEPDIGTRARSLGSTPAPDGRPPAPDLRAADVLNAVSKPITLADVDGASDGVEGVSPEPSTVMKTDTHSFPDTRHPEPADTRHPELASVNAVSVPPSSDLVLGQRVIKDGDRPTPVSPINFRDRQPQIVPGGHETPPMDEPPRLAARAPGENAPDVSASVKDGPPSEAPLADASLDGETRSAKPIVPASATAGEVPARTMSSPLSLSGLQVVAPHISVLSERPEQQRPVIERPARSDAGTSLQREASSLVASRGEVALPAQRPSSASTRKDEASHHDMKPPAPPVNPSGPSEDRPLEGRHNTQPVTATEAVGKLVLAALPGGAVQTTVAEGSLRPNIEFGVFDRLQSALSVESTPLDNVRFEAASNLGQFKTQTPSAPAPAGAQIALQIVRSLPDGVDRFSVHLQPAELGSVDIQLNFESGGRLSALITAERPETLELLQRDSRILERSLGDSGLKLANDGLSFALKQDQHQQQHGQGFHEQAQARHAAFRAERAYDDTPDTEQLPTAMRVDGLRLLDIET